MRGSIVEYDFKDDGVLDGCREKECDRAGKVEYGGG